VVEVHQLKLKFSVGDGTIFKPARACITVTDGLREVPLTCECLDAKELEVAVTLLKRQLLEIVAAASKKFGAKRPGKL
jgi:hypothetical protein